MRVVTRKQFKDAIAAGLAASDLEKDEVLKLIKVSNTAYEIGATWLTGCGCPLVRAGIVSGYKLDVDERHWKFVIAYDMAMKQALPPGMYYGLIEITNGEIE